jgi:hypothetical protein
MARRMVMNGEQTRARTMGFRAAASKHRLPKPNIKEIPIAKLQTLIRARVVAPNGPFRWLTLPTCWQVTRGALRTAPPYRGLQHFAVSNALRLVLQTQPRSVRGITFDRVRGLSERH